MRLEQTATPLHVTRFGVDAKGIGVSKARAFLGETMGRVTLTSGHVDVTHAPVTDDRFFKAPTILSFYEIVFFFRENRVTRPR